MSKRVLVAMSGGLDSSVTAALLKTQGYDVMAVYLQVRDPADASLPCIGGACCTRIDVQAVKKICAQLEIPLHVVSAQEFFQNDVVDPVLHDVIQGRLCNPCVKCNTQLKIRHFLKKADELKCEVVATGHYAKVVKNPDGTETNLYRASDKAFDQSYFLFELKQSELARLLMPLGDLLKANVQKMALTFGLESAENLGKPSGPTLQQICFIDDPGLNALVESKVADRYRPTGPVVDKEGHLLGRHSGIYKYRIGQTRDLEVDKPEAGQLTVAGFDMKLNAVILGQPEELLKDGLVASECNWIGVQDFSRGMSAKAKLRHYDQDVDCRITLLNNNSICVTFAEKQKGIISGQPIVFYQEDVVLGGGWIEALTDPVTTKMSVKQAAFTVS